MAANQIVEGLLDLLELLAHVIARWGERRGETGHRPDSREAQAPPTPPAT